MKRHLSASTVSFVLPKSSDSSEAALATSSASAHDTERSATTSTTSPPYPMPAGYHPGGLRAPLPENEDERVAALMSYRILDTPPEEAFDQLVFLASFICGTPVAVITFVSREQQWFKARLGLDASGTSRDSAFCAHTILDHEVMVVPDATKDVRFADNPLVTGALHVRFYAGAPIVTPEGQALGAICAIDTQPREIGAEQRRCLQILAKQVAAQLELGQRVGNLTETLSQLQDTKLQLKGSKEEAERALREAERAREQAEAANRAEQTQRLKAEEAQREAEKANSAKSAFLSAAADTPRTAAARRPARCLTCCVTAVSLPLSLSPLSQRQHVSRDPHSSERRAGHGFRAGRHDAD